MRISESSIQRKFVDRSFDPSIDWLHDWMIEWLIDCSIDWLIEWLNDWLIDWLNDRLIECLFDCLIGWLINCQWGGSSILLCLFCGLVTVFFLFCQGLVKDILYAAPESQLLRHQRADGTVALVSGIVFLSVAVAEQLLALLTSPAMESCTYIGRDTGASPTPVSLFFDMLLAMCSQMSEEDFLTRSSVVSKADLLATGDASRESAGKVRRLIWDNMRRFSLTAGVTSWGSFRLYLIWDVIGRSIDWLIDWFPDGLIHWLIDWWMDWLIDWFIDWLMLWLIDWCFSIILLPLFSACSWCQALVLGIRPLSVGA